MKILIVDDNIDTATMLSKFLELKSHSCVTAHDGRNGLVLAISKNFDVLLLDLAMPNFSGMDVVNELCKNGKIKEIKTIVFTASNLKNGEEAELKTKGVHVILRKPVELKFLLEALAT